MRAEERAAAFDEFASSMTPRLRRAALYVALDRHHADDLVQHALEKTFLHWQRACDAPYAYARRVMVNASTDWWRGVTRRERLGATPERASDRDVQNDYAQRDLVLTALAQLTARERAVMVLRFYEDMTEAQIAEALKIAPGTVKSTAHRALAKLRSSALSELAVEEN
jgi:RNA polymerase sigma-70 factor (sigma-E family)